jgi:hypothetical protein
MKLQYLCHLIRISTLIGCMSTSVWADPTQSDVPGAGAPAHDYPTIARVEYVNDCIGKNGGKLAALYQCSCAIDRIANALTYDDFVEASTFAKYATLPGQGGGIFRDSDQARKLAKSFRDLETDSWRACGIAH